MVSHEASFWQLRNDAFISLEFPVLNGRGSCNSGIVSILERLAVFIQSRVAFGSEIDYVSATSVEREFH